ncbi:MAG: multiheme c-type cytochrome, partial [Blastocatellia bacterium]
AGETMFKMTATTLFTLVIAAGFYFDAGSASEQAGSDITKNDSCVLCHSALSKPSDQATRYLEWRMSAHAANSVGCEKCHGGDPTGNNMKQAHRGVFPPSNSDSRLNSSTVSETCGACHQAISRSFVESAHYQKLKSSGMGPSCISCHGHMASSVRRNGSEGEVLCTYCHNAANGLLPQRPDIPANSKATLDAIQRTRYVLNWINSLLTKAEERNIAVDSEKKEASSVKAALEGSAIAWHTFNVKGVREMADKTYIQAVEIRDRLEKKVGRD